ncbi:MAG: hypothetical protein ACRDD8_16475 [Bacteroidales bacterium]
MLKTVEKIIYVLKIKDSKYFAYSGMHNRGIKITEDIEEILDKGVYYSIEPKGAKNNIEREEGVKLDIAKIKVKMEFEEIE